MRHSRLRWFGHVKRMNDEPDSLKFKNSLKLYHVDGKYKGQPKKRWIDNIKNDMRFLNINEDLTVDRVTWRSAINITRRRRTPTNGNRRR